MSHGVNKVILVGTLGNDPDVRNGVANISVATNESWTDKQSGEKKERTEWHRVTFFGRMAEIASEYLHKGSQVYIDGSLRTEKYEKDGVERHTTKIIANDMQMLGGRNEGGQRSGGGRTRAPSQNRPQRASAAPAQEHSDDFKDDDIPFISSRGIF